MRRTGNLPSVPATGKVASGGAGITTFSFEDRVEGRPKGPAAPISPVVLRNARRPFMTVSLRRVYLVSSKTPNESGRIGGRRWPGALTPSNIAIGRKILWVLKSIAMVRAYFFVGTFSTTL